MAPAKASDDKSPFTPRWFTNLLITILGAIGMYQGKKIMDKVDMIIDIQYDQKAMKERQDRMESDFKEHVQDVRTTATFLEAEKRLKLKYK